MKAAFTAVAVAALLACWAGTASAHSAHLPQGNDTFCVSNGDVSLTLPGTTATGLRWFLKHHEGFELVGRGACPEPPPPPPTPTPSAAPPPLDSHALGCYSHGQDDPEGYTIERYLFLTLAPQPELGGKPYWTTFFIPSVSRTPNGSPIGNGWYAHCNLAGPVLGHVTGSGDPISDVDWASTVLNWKSDHPFNNYEIRSS